MLVVFKQLWIKLKPLRMDSNMYTHDLALSLFKSSTTPESVLATNKEKLEKALSYLGSNHVLKTFVSKKAQPETFFLKA